MAWYLRGLPTNLIIRSEIHLGATRAELAVIPSVSVRRALGTTLFLFLVQRYVVWYLFSGNLFATLTATAIFFGALLSRRIDCRCCGGVIEVGYRRIRYPVGSREN